jgi:S-methylmethionine-dependent homocysteine/selenocysteine methylase
VWVLGSSPTLEDCYHPERVPNAAALAREHAEHARHLALAGVDAILVETMNTRREAVAALRAANARRCARARVVRVLGRRAPALGRAALPTRCARAADEAACAVLVNCLPPSNADPCLDVLAAQPLPVRDLPEPRRARGRARIPRSEELAPERFAGLAGGLGARGARVLGGCCGTTPRISPRWSRASARQPSGT